MIIVGPSYRSPTDKLFYYGARIENNARLYGGKLFPLNELLRKLLKDFPETLYTEESRMGLNTSPVYIGDLEPPGVIYEYSTPVKLKDATIV